MLFEDAEVELTLEGVLELVTEEDANGCVYVDLADKSSYILVEDYFSEPRCFSDMEEFFGRIDYFLSSGKVRKDKLMEKLLDICAERNERRADVRFTKDMLEKGFIEKTDTSMCIKKLRERGQYHLLPLMILKDAGEFDRKR